MAQTKTTSSPPPRGVKNAVGRLFASVPLLGFLFGFLACVLVEMAVGDRLANLLGLSKIPVLFGIVTIFKAIAGLVNTIFKGAAFDPGTLFHIPMALVYFGIVYLAPVAWLPGSHPD